MWSIWWKKRHYVGQPSKCVIPTVCALSSLSLEMNSLGLDWREGVRGGTLDAGGGQWVREGVASLEMVNRIIKRAAALPRRQKRLMISLIFAAQCNTGWTLWTFTASARHYQQAFHHTQLWPCEIPCNFTNSPCVRVAAGREERERENMLSAAAWCAFYTFRRGAGKFSVNFRHLNAKMQLIWDDNRRPNRSWSFAMASSLIARSCNAMWVDSSEGKKRRGKKSGERHR